MKQISETKCFNGRQLVVEHDSTSCNGTMTVGIFLPHEANDGPVPVLYWLSGLTCTHENFVTKAGAQRYAAEHGIAIVAPDTSPRGAGVEGEDDNWDLGTGAGFYVDATVDKWSSHYNMYSYITSELPALINKEFPVDPSRCGIFGHSMGGHGALVCGLRNPDMYKSISAFAPIVSPSRCPWGENALGSYLGEDRESWRAYDSYELLIDADESRPLLVDQGDADEFLDQLQPELLQEACDKSGTALTLNMQPGYDHSYYFIASFIGEHLAHHAAILKA